MGKSAGGPIPIGRVIVNEVKCASEDEAKEKRRLFQPMLPDNEHMEVWGDILVTVRIE